MKVLIVTHHYLHGYGGGVFASRGFINAIAALCGDVTLMCPVADGRKPEHISPGVKILEVRDTRSSFGKVWDLMHGCFHRFRRVFPQLLSHEQFDLIVFDSSYPSGGLMEEARRHGCRIVTIHHNWQYEYEKDNAKGLLRPLRLFWSSRCEKNAVLGSSLNIALTEQDREALYREYDPGRTCKIIVCPPFEYE